MFLVEGEQVGVLEIGVEFDLIDGGCDGRGLQDGFEVGDQVVGDAD